MVRFESVNDVINNVVVDDEMNHSSQEVIDITRAAHSFNDRIVRASSLETSVLDVPWEVEGEGQTVNDDDEEAPPLLPPALVQQGSGCCGRRSSAIVTASACCLALVASAGGVVVGWQMQSTRNRKEEEGASSSSFNQQQMAAAAATANNNNNNEIDTTTHGNGHTNGTTAATGSSSNSSTTVTTTTATSSIRNPNNNATSTTAVADGEEEVNVEGQDGKVVGVTTVAPTSSTFPSTSPTVISPSTTTITTTTNTTTPSPNLYYPTYSPTVTYSPTPNPTIVTLSPTTYDYQYDIIKTALIKLYWEDSYKWTLGQPPNTINVIDDPRYCMVCLNNCLAGDTILLEECDYNDNDQYFTFIGRTIRPRDNLSLCLTVISYDPSKDTNGWPIPTPIELRDCSSSNDDGGNNVKQQFIGYDSSGSDVDVNMFEIMTIEKPMNVEWCLGNAHFPKPGEMIHPKWCSKGLGDTTVYWETY